MAAKFEVVIEVGEGERAILDLLSDAVSQGTVTAYQIKRTTLREVSLPEFYSYGAFADGLPENVRAIGSILKKGGDAA